MEKLKKIWIDYIQFIWSELLESINWFFVGILYLILNMFLIFDNWSIYKFLILSGVFVLMTILAYIKRKIDIKTRKG